LGGGGGGGGGLALCEDPGCCERVGEVPVPCLGPRGAEAPKVSALQAKVRDFWAPAGPLPHPSDNSGSGGWGR